MGLFDASCMAWLRLANDLQPLPFPFPSLPTGSPGISSVGATDDRGGLRV
jgi:hypothetical protein